MGGCFDTYLPRDSQPVLWAQSRIDSRPNPVTILSWDRQSGKGVRVLIFAGGGD